MNTKNTTAIATTDQNTGYLTETVNLAELFSEELDGLRPSFERIKIPAGGGLAYEVPGDDPNSPDSAKDFSAVILYHHPINSYYKEKIHRWQQSSRLLQLRRKAWRRCRDRRMQRMQDLPVCQVWQRRKRRHGLQTEAPYVPPTRRRNAPDHHDATHRVAGGIHEICHPPCDPWYEGQSCSDKVLPEACAE